MNAKNLPSPLESDMIHVAMLEMGLIHNILNDIDIARGRGWSYC